MSRLERLKQYANPLHGQRDGRLFGSASDKQNLAEWSARATENSQIAPRAKGAVLGGPNGTAGQDAPKLPSTKQINNRDTAARPFKSRKINKLMKGDEPSDKNNVGSSFMKSVRREA